MGDRANVHVFEGKGDNGVYLYTHWNGTELPVTLQTALRRKQRWTDVAYLARIIFGEMVKGEEAGVTGFGIGTSMCDGQARILHVDTESQTVTVNEGRKFSFEEYCSWDEPHWGDSILRKRI